MPLCGEGFLSACPRSLPHGAAAPTRGACAWRVDGFACAGTFLKEEFIAKVTCQQIVATSPPSRRWNQLKVEKKNCHMHGFFFFFPECNFHLR